MKVRSWLLIGCLALVPLLAMFSHRIPRDWRMAFQRFARGEGFVRADRVAWGGETARVEEPASFKEPAVPPVAVEPPDRPPASRPEAFGAGRAGSGVHRDEAVVRAEVEHQLAALGAVAFACAQVPTGGLHRCSCRVSADPSGQLQRVFQSSNPDPVVALRNLLGQVQFWKHRLTAQSAASSEPAAARTLRR